jgi:hypothetical protein
VRSREWRLTFKTKESASSGACGKNPSRSSHYPRQAQEILDLIGELYAVERDVLTHDVETHRRPDWRCALGCAQNALARWLKESGSGPNRRGSYRGVVLVKPLATCKSSGPA